jgi:hypothetical protein
VTRWPADASCVTESFAMIDDHDAHEDREGDAVFVLIVASPRGVYLSRGVYLTGVGAASVTLYFVSALLSVAARVKSELASAIALGSSVFESV